MSSLKKQAGYLIVGKAFDFAIQFFIPIILVRLLSKESYGDYRQVMLIALFFINIIPFGFANSLLYFYSIAGEKRDQLISQTLFALLISGMIFSVLFILFKYQIAIFFNNETFLSYIIPAGLFMLFSVGSIIFENLLVVEKRSKYVLIYLISNQFLRSLFLISTILLFKTIEAVLWAFVIFSFFRLVIFLFYIFRHYNISFATLNRGYFLSQFNYAIPLGLGKLVGSLGKKIDKFILAALLTSTDFAIYSVGYFSVPIATILYISIGHVALPKLSQSSIKGEDEIAKNLWHKMISYYSLVTIPYVFFILIMADQMIIFLYTEKYIESGIVMKIFSLMLLFQMCSYGTILKAYKCTRFIFFSNLFSLIIGVALSWVFIKQWGINGGAVAAVIIFGMNAAFQLVKAKSILNLNFINWLPWKNIYKVAVCSLISAIPILIIQRIEMKAIANILVGGIVYSIILSLMFQYFKLINLNEAFNQLISEIKKVRG